MRASRRGGKGFSAVSGSIAVIYAGDLAAMAEAFGEAAAYLVAPVRLLRVSGGESDERATDDPRAGLGNLDRAADRGRHADWRRLPRSDPMRFIASTQPLWRSSDSTIRPSRCSPTSPITSPPTRFCTRSMTRSTSGER